MATARIQFPHEARYGRWFLNFLRQELAPYPGRGALVARMVISATLTMILIVTFKIPGGYVGALTAFLFSRENLISTARSAAFMILSFLIGALFIPVGARLLASTPETHFLWVGGSIFLAFFLLRCLTNYGVAIGLAIVIANVIGIWYLPGPGERNVELTLWLVAATSLGAVVTLAVETVFHAIDRRDELMDGIDVRLAQVEALMRAYGSGQAIAPENAKGLTQYMVVGVGALRRYIARTVDEPAHRDRMSALVSITGRSVDFAAALSSTVPVCDPADQARAAKLADRIAIIRERLRNNAIVEPWDSVPSGKDSTPLISGLEAMVALTPSVFVSSASIDPRLQIIEEPVSSNRLFIADAFSNPEHLRYILGGTLAAMLCYVFYVSLDWRNLSTSVTTCVLTALTSVGSSRQKQVLRIAGFVLGGVIAGLGAQIFILPSIDSIGGFAVLFATVTAVAAWVASGSSRISYAGVQIAFSFYIIHLSDFSFQTDLTIPRDRVLGVLLGVTMMWLVFERLFPRAAADEMVRIFVRNIRLMADLVDFSPTGGDEATIVKIRRQRDQIYRLFGDVNTQADAVPFETGPARAGHMAARDRIRRWQTSLRTFYLAEAPLLQFRVFATAEERAGRFTWIESAFRSQCALVFRSIADCLEHQLTRQGHSYASPCTLQSMLAATLPEDTSEFSEREQALLRMTRTIASMVDRLQSEVAAEALYATD
jgi:multidrug resistance protein MdtO